VLLRPVLQRLYCGLVQRPWPVRLLAALLLVPALALLVDLQLALHLLWELPQLLARGCCHGGEDSQQQQQQQQPAAKLLLGCLVPWRCFVMRSFVMVLCQSGPSVAFTTWGYVATRKYDVGKFITQVRLQRCAPVPCARLLALTCRQPGQNAARPGSTSQERCSKHPKAPTPSTSLPAPR
jgi:hypothetical protein